MLDCFWLYCSKWWWSWQ